MTRRPRDFESCVLLRVFLFSMCCNGDCDKNGRFRITGITFLSQDDDGKPSKRLPGSGRRLEMPASRLMLVELCSWPNGGIGRRNGLKIRRRSLDVSVRPRLRPPSFNRNFECENLCCRGDTHRPKLVSRRTAAKQPIYNL